MNRPQSASAALRGSVASMRTIRAGSASALAIFAGIVGLTATGAAQAQGFSATVTSSTCQGADLQSSKCGYGPTLQLASHGPAVSSSVAKGWSQIASPGSLVGFNLGGTAQGTLRGVDSWSAYARVGGYIGEDFYGFNAAGASAQTQIHDVITPQHTATWTGLGTMVLSYRVTGFASITSSLAGTPVDGTQHDVSSTIGFGCASSLRPGYGSPCQVTGTDYFDALDGLSGFTYTGSQSVDRVVTFSFEVVADAPVSTFFSTSVGAHMSLGAGAHPLLLTGAAVADFSHTFSLVDATLEDGSGQRLDDWTASSASGFDYAHVAAVPEPPTAALLGLGALCLTGVSRARRLARA